MSTSSIESTTRNVPRLRMLILAALALAAPVAIIAIMTGPAILYTIAHHTHL